MEKIVSVGFAAFILVHGGPTQLVRKWIEYSTSNEKGYQSVNEDVHGIKVARNGFDK
jgi:hypothetical protein